MSSFSFFFFLSLEHPFTFPLFICSLIHLFLPKINQQTRSSWKNFGKENKWKKRKKRRAKSQGTKFWKSFGFFWELEVKTRRAKKLIYMEKRTLVVFSTLIGLGSLSRIFAELRYFLFDSLGFVTVINQHHHHHYTIL